MAVDRKEFVKKVDKGLKANKSYDRFYISFKKNNKTVQKVLDYSQQQWDKRTRISKAKMELLNLKEKVTDTVVGFTENSTLNTVADIYFDVSCDTKSAWTKERLDVYNLYCRNGIGKKKINHIKMIDIDLLRKSMETKGHSKQTENGCSPRTIRKVLLQVLKPILEYAKNNKIINDYPPIKVPKAKNNRKKIVKNAPEKLIKLYRAIFELYKDHSFYRALFLFALYGRRWNEIRTLMWYDVDFSKKTYTIRAENNKIGEDQTYVLPLVIEEALLQIPDNFEGLVFKSPVTNKMLYTPKKQLAKIKKFTNIQELTMHYFRHILVSAMGEQGVEGTILSASLGHVNLDTVYRYYLSVNHEKSSQKANNVIENMMNIDF